MLSALAPITDIGPAGHGSTERTVEAVRWLVGLAVQFERYRRSPRPAEHGRPVVFWDRALVIGVLGNELRPYLDVFGIDTVLPSQPVCSGVRFLQCGHGLIGEKEGVDFRCSQPDNQVEPLFYLSNDRVYVRKRSRCVAVHRGISLRSAVAGRRISLTSVSVAFLGYATMPLYLPSTKGISHSPFSYF